MLAAFALLGLEFMPFSRHSNQASDPVSRREKNLNALIPALVEFHKTQCFFAGAIQIACIVFAIQALFKFDITNAELLFTIATNGYIPVIFTLTCIARYGRQSWYLILLSMCCLMLSTVTLSCSYLLFLDYWDLPDWASFGDVSSIAEVCGYVPSQLLPSWCGFKPSYPKLLKVRLITSWWNLAPLINCMFWGLYCVVKQALNCPPKSPEFYSSRTFRLKIYLQAKVILSNPMFDRICYLLFLTTWSLTFGYQFYLYSLFFANADIATTWSFGQIVAITVWTPCLAEYFHLVRR